MKPETESRAHSQNGSTHPIITQDEGHNGQEDTSMAMTVDSLDPSAWTPMGFSRHELVRLMVQSLQSLGYKKSALELESESGYQLESPSVTLFRECVLQGKWDKVEQLTEELDLDPVHGLPVVKFLIRQQKFLELLEARQIKNALVVLRSELTPLNQDIDRVHMLTSYMMSSSAEDLRVRAQWDGVGGSSRQTLLSSLQKFISPAVMVPENRLETMLHQAIELQAKNCVYHDNRNTANSLYSDHICDKSGIPTVTKKVLDNHTDEVWFIAFSHDGRYLASASADSRVIIWNMETFEPVHTLQGHTNKVSCCAWSPDDSQLLTGGYDKSVKLWDVRGAMLKSTYLRHNEVSCSGDMIRQWQFSVRDLAISYDGQTLVAMGGTMIRIINLVDLSEISKVEEADGIMAIGLSRDGNHLLVTTALKPEKLPLMRDIHLWNLQEGRIERKYSGYKQGLFVVRTCFGGWDDRLVVSGSEDHKVYIWHRENGKLIQTLEGHTKAVTCVAWSPTNPTMFASASDDYTIRM
ncbi:hypothetical protein BGZ83_000735 [Gryganskiella cystojenkinii]|nr:hypothetical protein BGZ83_000735 [Gryganskiella cystojenkinii]